jgi:hypothetical protein
MDAGWSKMVVRFGKYAGMLYTDIRRIDPKYASFLTSPSMRMRLARENWLTHQWTIGVRQPGINGGRPRPLQVPSVRKLTKNHRMA